MNLNRDQGTKLVNHIAANLGETQVEVAVCCPATLLMPIGEVIRDTPVQLGAQNMHWEDSGAYTGEISWEMLKECGVTYVIIGHSERRSLFGETDEMINKKIRKALENNLTPIFCVGETLEERENGSTFNVLEKQLNHGLKNVEAFAGKELVVAYEPVWAIGTGKTATADQANEAIGLIRSFLAKKYDKGLAESVRILYGGSVKQENAEEIMNGEEIDGALVGGASLDADGFLGIIHF